MQAPSSVSLSKVLEPRRAQLRVACRVHDRDMTKPVLDRGRVDPIVRGRQCAKLIATDRMHSVAATLGAARLRPNSICDHSSSQVSLARSLAGWPSPLDYVFGDTRLRDLKPELEQFAVNAIAA
jgi:hypothetical protein